MLRLNLESLNEVGSWNDNNIVLPEFDIDKTRNNTKENPEWIHFGAGNIFRGFLASNLDDAINTGESDCGVIAVVSPTSQLYDKVYKNHDNLTLLTSINSHGEIQNKVIASIAECLRTDLDFEKLKKYFKKQSVRLASFTITEKGYEIKNNKNEYFEVVKRDLENGPDKPNHLMSIVTSLIYSRYKKGKLPIALVSMDNCSNNGDKLKSSIIEIAENWELSGYLEREFILYLMDEKKVSFPLTMIDKITPRPSEAIASELKNLGFTDMELIVDKNTCIAPFVNAEITQYLVIEDKFPNGRPRIENTRGVIFTDRNTVNKVEKMKVTTCLNPLHTTLAVFGCLLGYDSISSEMKDKDLKKLIEKIGYIEGLPVVVNPEIINPENFIDEVINERFPNPNIPDTPQRIATDTSQKIGIRFGETIKSYRDNKELNPEDLIFIPLAIAGWIRYLQGIDDEGNTFDISPDPMLEELKNNLSNVKSIISNTKIFGIDLYEIGLGTKIEKMYEELSEGIGSVRKTIIKYLKS